MSTFYILSLKHTSKSDEHITVWGWFDRGYTPVIGAYAGRYCYGEAVSLNDGQDCIAVPCELVTPLLSGVPHFGSQGTPRRFYDQDGPVLDNTRAVWNRLIAASLKHGRRTAKLTPEVFRGVRRSFDFTRESMVAA